MWKLFHRESENRPIPPRPTGVFLIPDVDPIELAVRENKGGTYE